MLPVVRYRIARAWSGVRTFVEHDGRPRHPGLREGIVVRNDAVNQKKGGGAITARPWSYNPADEAESTPDSSCASGSGFSFAIPRGFG